ncbi:hypothetical protein GJ496_002586 [Pomphorhynchus laevis]|nr:hypothetical protein GJ496_002586 [Pomphorhynchus laevis]
MKIEREKIKRVFGNLSAECSELIERIKTCSDDDLVNQLEATKIWPIGMCELYHWIDVLDRLDVILEFCTSKDSWTLKCDQIKLPDHAERKRLLLAILDFTASLLDHSYSRYMYNSVDHLTKLLQSSDIQILIGALNALYFFSNRSTYISKLPVYRKIPLFDELRRLAKSWGNKYSGFDIASCCKSNSMEDFTSEAMTLALEFSPAPNITAQKPRTIVLNVDYITRLADTPSELMESLLVEHSHISDSEKADLFFKIRLAFYFPFPELRVGFVKARLLATSIILHSKPNLEELNQLIYEGFLTELIDTLSLEDDEILDVKAVIMKTLTSIVHLDTNSKLLDVIGQTQADIYHGFLPTLVRQGIHYLLSDLNAPDLDEDHRQRVEQFSTSLLSFLYHLANHKLGGKALVDSGIVKSMLNIVTCFERKSPYLVFVTRAVRVIDLVTNFDMHEFINCDGIQICVKRLKFEIYQCQKDLTDYILLDDDGSVDVNAHKLHDMPLGIHCSHKPETLIKSILNFFKKAVGNATLTESIRPVMESSLPECLEHIIRNVHYYRPSLFLLAAEIISVYIYQEPSHLPYLQELGLTDTLITALLEKDVPATREILAALPGIFRAMCLNDAGLQSFLRCRPFERLFRVFIKPNYIYALQKKRITDSNQGIASNIGAAVEVLIRHQPELKQIAIDSLLTVFDELYRYGNLGMFVNFRHLFRRNSSKQHQPGSDHDDNSTLHDLGMPTQMQLINENMDEDHYDFATGGTPGLENIELVDEQQHIDSSNCDDNVLQSQILDPTITSENLVVDEILTNTFDENTGEVLSNYKKYLKIRCKNEIFNLPCNVSRSGFQFSARHPMLLEFIPNLMKFAESMLTNDSVDHTRVFLDKQGLSCILNIITMKNLSLDFANSTAGQSISSIVEAILSHTRDITIVEAIFHNISVLLRQLIDNYQPFSFRSSILLDHILKVKSRKDSQPENDDSDDNILRCICYIHSYLTILSTVNKSQSQDIKDKLVDAWSSEVGMDILSLLCRLLLIVSWETYALMKAVDNSYLNFVTFGKLRFVREKLKRQLCLNAYNRILNNQISDNNINKLPVNNCQTDEDIEIDDIFLGDKDFNDDDEYWNSFNLDADTLKKLRENVNRDFSDNCFVCLQVISKLGAELTTVMNTLTMVSVGAFSRRRRNSHYVVYSAQLLYSSIIMSEIHKNILALYTEVIDSFLGVQISVSLLTCIAKFLLLVLFDDKFRPYHLSLRCFTETTALNIFFKAVNYIINHENDFSLSIVDPSLRSLWLECFEAHLNIIYRLINMNVISESPHIIVNFNHNQSYQYITPLDIPIFAASVQEYAFLSLSPIFYKKLLGSLSKSISEKFIATFCMIMNGVKERDIHNSRIIRNSSAYANMETFINGMLKLFSMGFSRRQSVVVLETFNGHVETAIDRLVNKNLPRAANVAIANEHINRNPIVWYGNSKDVDDIDQKTTILQITKLNSFLEYILFEIFKLLDLDPYNLHKYAEFVTCICYSISARWFERLSNMIISKIECMMLQLPSLFGNVDIEGGEMEEQLFYQKLNRRILFFNLLLQERLLQVVNIMKPYGILHTTMSAICHTIDLINSGSVSMTDKHKWLAPALLLIDQYEKSVILNYRFQIMQDEYRDCIRVWKWFDSRQNRWVSYNLYNNLLMDFAFMEHRVLLKIVINRRNYLVNFATMIQINVDTRYNGPIMYWIIPTSGRQRYPSVCKTYGFELPVIPTFLCVFNALIGMSFQNEPSKCLPNVKACDVRKIVKLSPKFIRNCRDSDTLHAFLRLIVRYTREETHTKTFVDNGGVESLLQMRRKVAFQGCVPMIVLIIRHIMENTANLALSMEKAIRQGFVDEISMLGGNHREMFNASKVFASLLCRDQSVCLDVTSRILRITKPSNRRAEDDLLNACGSRCLITCNSNRPSVTLSKIAQKTITILLNHLVADNEIRTNDSTNPIITCDTTILGESQSQQTFSCNSPAKDTPSKVVQNAQNAFPNISKADGDRNSELVVRKYVILQIVSELVLNYAGVVAQVSSHVYSTDDDSVCILGKTCSMTDASDGLNDSANSPLNLSYQSSVKDDSMNANLYVTSIQSQSKGKQAMLAYVLDHLLINSISEGDEVDAPCADSARALFVSIAVSNHSVESQRILVSEIKYALHRACMLADIHKRRERIKALAGVVSLLIQACPPTGNRSIPYNRDSPLLHCNNMVRLMLDKGVFADFARIFLNFQLNGDNNLIDTVNAVLKPLKLLSSSNASALYRQSHHSDICPSGQGIFAEAIERILTTDDNGHSTAEPSSSITANPLPQNNNSFDEVNNSPQAIINFFSGANQNADNERSNLSDISERANDENEPNEHLATVQGESASIERSQFNDDIDDFDTRDSTQTHFTEPPVFLPHPVDFERGSGLISEETSDDNDDHSEMGIDSLNRDNRGDDDDDEDDVDEEEENSDDDDDNNDSESGNEDNESSSIEIEIGDNNVNNEDDDPMEADEVNAQLRLSRELRRNVHLFNTGTVLGSTDAAANHHTRRNQRSNRLQERRGSLGNDTVDDINESAGFDEDDDFDNHSTHSVHAPTAESLHSHTCSDASSDSNTDDTLSDMNESRPVTITLEYSDEDISIEDDLDVVIDELDEDLEETMEIDDDEEDGDEEEEDGLNDNDEDENSSNTDGTASVVFIPNDEHSNSIFENSTAIGQTSATDFVNSPRTDNPALSSNTLPSFEEFVSNSIDRIDNENNRVPIPHPHDHDHEPIFPRRRPNVRIEVPRELMHLANYDFDPETFRVLNGTGSELARNSRSNNHLFSSELPSDSEVDDRHGLVDNDNNENDDDDSLGSEDDASEEDDGENEDDDSILNDVSSICFGIDDNSSRMNEFLHNDSNFAAAAAADASTIPTSYDSGRRFFGLSLAGSLRASLQMIDNQINSATFASNVSPFPSVFAPALNQQISGTASNFDSEASGYFQLSLVHPLIANNNNQNAAVLPSSVQDHYMPVDTAIHSDHDGHTLSRIHNSPAMMFLELINQRTREYRTLSNATSLMSAVGNHHSSFANPAASSALPSRQLVSRTATAASQNIAASLQPTARVSAAQLLYGEAVAQIAPHHSPSIINPISAHYTTNVQVNSSASADDAIPQQSPATDTQSLEINDQIIFVPTANNHSTRNTRPGIASVSANNTSGMPTNNTRTFNSNDDCLSNDTLFVNYPSAHFIRSAMHRWNEECILLDGYSFQFTLASNKHLMLSRIFNQTPDDITRVTQHRTTTNLPTNISFTEQARNIPPRGQSWSLFTISRRDPRLLATSGGNNLNQRRYGVFFQPSGSGNDGIDVTGVDADMEATGIVQRSSRSVTVDDAHAINEDQSHVQVCDNTTTDIIDTEIPLIDINNDEGSIDLTMQVDQQELEPRPAAYGESMNELQDLSIHSEASTTSTAIIDVEHCSSLSSSDSSSYVTATESLFQEDDEEQRLEDQQPTDLSTPRTADQTDVNTQQSPAASDAVETIIQRLRAELPSITINDREYPIPDNVDQSVLFALPDNIREEVLTHEYHLWFNRQQVRIQNEQAVANLNASRTTDVNTTVPANSGESQQNQHQPSIAPQSADISNLEYDEVMTINTEILAALPPELQDEVLSQQRLMQLQLRSENGEPPGDFLRCMPYHQRRVLYIEMDQSEINFLPEDLANEARQARRTGSSSSSTRWSRLPQSPQLPFCFRESQIHDECNNDDGEEDNDEDEDDHHNSSHHDVCDIDDENPSNLQSILPSESTNARDHERIYLNSNFDNNEFENNMADNTVSHATNNADSDENAIAVHGLRSFTFVRLDDINRESLDPYHDEIAAEGIDSGSIQIASRAETNTPGDLLRPDQFIPMFGIRNHSSRRGRFFRSNALRPARDFDDHCPVICRYEGLSTYFEQAEASSKLKMPLDLESLCCILVLLFTDNSRIQFSRLQRIIRNLCYHFPTRVWIINSLFDIIIRCTGNVEVARIHRIAKHGSHLNRKLSDETSGSTSENKSVFSNWLTMTVQSPFGHKASVLKTHKFVKHGSFNTLHFTINSAVCSSICSQLLDTLILLSKLFAHHFLLTISLPLEYGNELNKDCNFVKASSLPNAANESSDRAPSFWDMVVYLDTVCARQKHQLRGHGKLCSHLNVPFNKTHIAQNRSKIDYSPFALILTLFDHNVINSDQILIEKLFKLTAHLSASLSSPEVIKCIKNEINHAKAQSNLSISSGLDKIAGQEETFYSNRLIQTEDMTNRQLPVNSSTNYPTNSVIHDSAASLIESLNCQRREEVSLIDDEYVLFEYRLQSMVKTMISNLISTEAMVYATEVLMSITATNKATAKHVYQLLINGLRELAAILEDELSELIGQASIHTMIKGDIQPMIRIPITSMWPGSNPGLRANMNPLPESTSFASLAHDSFLNDPVPSDLPSVSPMFGSENSQVGLANQSRIRDLKRDVRLPSMKAFTCKQSNQKSYLRILKVIIQLRECGRDGYPLNSATSNATNNESGDVIMIDFHETRDSTVTSDAAVPSDNYSSIDLSSGNAEQQSNNSSTGNIDSSVVETENDAVPVTSSDNVVSSVKTPDQQSSDTTKEPSPPVKVDEETRKKLSDELDCNHLWRLISECLTELQNLGDNHAVMILQPCVEAFFLVYSSGVSKNDANRRTHSNRDACDRDLHSRNVSHLIFDPVTINDSTVIDQLAIENTFSNLGRQSSDLSNFDSDTSKFLNFANAHRTVLNNILRASNQKLREGPFAILAYHTNVLDFDVKRKFFRSELDAIKPTTREDLAFHVNRNTVFEDSYRKLHNRLPSDWRRKFYFSFDGEEGQDAGGLLRECYFKFVGKVIAKAIYDNKYLDCFFTRFFYKHILGVPVDHTDMEAVDNHFYKNLKYIMDNDVDHLDLTFCTDIVEFGETKTIDLIENGRNILVTNNNKLLYIQLVCREKMIGSIRQQTFAFLEGFYSIIPKRLISIFNEQELELLISGLPDIDIEDLKANTEYHKYRQNAVQIQWFWRALRSFEKDDLARFIQFVTGTSRVPLGGFANLEGMNGQQKFQIHKDERSTDRLPCAHTCFNQLDLPAYESYDKLRSSLLTAINECTTGFGLA